MLKKLKELIPDNIEVIIIADRGVGRKSDLANYIECLGFKYVMKAREDVFIQSKVYNGLVKNFKSKTNKIYDIKNVKRLGFKIKTTHMR